MQKTLTTGALLILTSSFLCFAEEDKESLEVIEVTAQKRVQSIQSIPIAITAINDTELEKWQIIDASGIAQLAPNVNVTRSISGVYNYFIRGVGIDDFNLSSIPAVGLYIDDVAIQNPVLANFSLLDIERVEVMRGPQNTLYGKNTTGGAINFISHRAAPTPDLEGQLGVFLGSDNLMRFKANANTGIGEDSAVSLTISHETQDGRVSGKHIDNHSDFHNRDRFSAKLNLTSKLTDTLDFQLAFYGGQQQQISEVKTLVTATNDSGIIDIDDFDLRKLDSPLVNPRNNLDTMGGFLKFVWQLGAHQLTSISAFEQVDSERMDDWGSQSLPSNVFQVITYNSSNTEAYSQEFQLLSPSDQNLTWLLGASVNVESGDILQTAYIDPAGPGRPDDGVSDAGIGPLFDRGAWVDVDTTSYSVYGQFDASYDEKNTLSMGLRWTSQSLTPTVHSAGMLMDSVERPFPLGTFGWYSLGNPGFDITRDFAGFSVIRNFIDANGGFPASANIDKTFNEWGGKVSLTHQLNQQAMVYGQISKGFKMGAVNSNPTTAAFQALLDNTVVPETLVTYEMGLKSQWLNDKLRLNVAAFWNDWQDYQFFLVYNPGNPANLFASLVNLPEARTRGVEIEATALLSDSWKLITGLGYIDAEVTDGELNTQLIAEPFRDGFQNAVLTGDRLPNTPEWVMNNTLEGSWELSQGDLSVRISHQFIDEHIHALAGNNSTIWQQNFSEKSVNLLSLSIQYIPNDFHNIRWLMWAKNLTDEHYCSERATIPGTNTETVRLCAQGQFREVGLGIMMAL